MARISKTLADRLIEEKYKERELEKDYKVFKKKWDKALTNSTRNEVLDHGFNSCIVNTKTDFEDSVLKCSFEDSILLIEWIKENGFNYGYNYTKFGTHLLGFVIYWYI